MSSEGGSEARGLAIYADRRMLVILGMGFSSGLPLLVTSSALSLWLRQRGIDLTTIGFFSLVGLPYALKFLWAPFFDHVRLPWLGERLGQRRSWTLVVQSGLALAIATLGFTDPASAPLATAGCAFLVAFLSASQDIVIDAYRIEILGEREQGAGAAATQAGYRIGMIVVGSGAPALSDWIEWRAVFALLGVLVGVGIATTLLAREPAVRHTPRASGAGAALRRGVVEPLSDFLTRRGWLAILAFALLYKFGDAIGGVMANPFYKDLGFTGTQIGAASPPISMVASILGVTLGGVLVARTGILRALVIGGVLQALTNLFYALLAEVGPRIELLALVVGVDAFTGGLGSAAFVAYFSSLCRAPYTATQYALLTSLMAAGRTVLSAGAGVLAQALGWAAFFAATTLLAAPGLLLLAWLVHVDRQLRLATLEGGQ